MFLGIRFALILCLLVNLAYAKMLFTALEIDNHPCKPENLKHTKRYICDSQGSVICQTGWTEPENQTPETEMNPCLEPICNHNDLRCVHGDCRAPNYCACEVGWEGPNCNVCVPLPGCEYGSCQNAFECNCEEGWEGAYCDIPSCNNCTNGHCLSPNQCVCNSGWEGSNCDVCQKMEGCVHGSCGVHPHACICAEGWEGHLCDKPVCNLGCNHGFCHANNIDGVSNFCVCQSGWRGDQCEQCRPYWNCPNQSANACRLPNECFCFGGENDSQGLCNNTILIQKLMFFENNGPGAPLLLN